MGLRNWLNRPIHGHRPGVKDVTEGVQSLPASLQRGWALRTIDSSPFQVWVVVVAGIGFLTDAYDIFALNVVTPMLGYVFWPNQSHNTTNGVPEVPQKYLVGMICATLAGTMVGQIGFGIAADFVGRRKMYGLELVIVIVGTILMVTSSTGQSNSMNAAGWLITWRLVMGIGIGADYPLSAVITSEFAPRRHRARMLCFVFFSQPLGQLLANLLALAAVSGYKNYIPDDKPSCENNAVCIQSIDRIWRLVVGLGAIPAVIALAFRFTIPESPRYKLDVQRNVNKVCDDTQHYYGLGTEESEMGSVYRRPNANGEVEQLAMNGIQPGQRRASTGDSEIGPDEIIESESDDGMTDPPPRHRSHASEGTEIPLGDPRAEPPLASREDMKNFFVTEGNWRYLLGTSLSWAFLDFAFYGLGMSSPAIVRRIWPGSPSTSVYESLRDNSWHSLVLISSGAIVGGAAMIKAIKHASPKVIQFWGFLVLFVLFMITGVVWNTLLKNNQSGQSDQSGQSALVVLYVLCQFAFNLGPNVTTFIIPAEIFPTRYRCTCHGISAAAGKLGSSLAQIYLAFSFKSKKLSPEQNWGYVLLVMGAFMLAGAITTHFLVPETRDKENKSRSLEELAVGRKGLKRERQRDREERDRNGA